MAIEIVKVRALIRIGNSNLIAGTPPLGYPNHILSFNVDKARGQISTFSASLKVRRDEVTGGLLDDASVSIYAGTTSTYLRNKIFTGAIKTVTMSPNRDDPEYVILNISGNDILSRLTGKKYTRRCRSTKGVWVGITGVTRQGLRAGKLAYEPTEAYLGMYGGDLNMQDNLTSTRPPITEEQVEAVSEDSDNQEVKIDVYSVEEEMVGI
ncbi:MAG: hypothetical protein PVG39_10230 [Desulfobacteraceae bacterium]|jgi:hypothetical protein